MSLLRHPVVLTSMEEDFRKIGLLTEEQAPKETQVGPDGLPEGQGGVAGTGNPGKNKRKEGSASDLTMGYKPGGDKLHAQDSGREDPSMDYGTTEGDESEDQNTNLAEAARFHNEFVEAWDEMGAAGVPDLILTAEDMKVLEGMAEEVTDLPAGIIAEEDDSEDEEDDEDEDEEDDEDEDEEDDEDEDEDEEDDEEEESKGRKTERKAKTEEDNSEDEVEEQVASALDAIEHLAGQKVMETVGEATAAFANLALIAENLYSFFAEKDVISESTDHASIAESFEEMAKTSAGIVDVLKSEPDTLDGDRLRETFKEYIETTLSGLETYVGLHEEDDEDDEDEEDEEESAGPAEGKGRKTERKAKTEEDDEEDDDEDEEESAGPAERKERKGK
jgi:hypothetical protein